MLYLLEVREKAIFETLKALKDCNFIVIGGYAINVYTQPRFSVDCDIVIKHNEESKVRKILEDMGYNKENESKIKTQYHGEFIRYEKNIENNFKVSIDLLIDKVVDRQTNAILEADWIFNNSAAKILKGKTIQEKITAKIPSVECLIVMKLLSCRNTDVRDIFMMLPKAKNLKLIMREVSVRTNFDKRFVKLKEKVMTKDFKNNLQGVFGFVPEKIFDKHKQLVIALGKSNIF